MCIIVGGTQGCTKDVSSVNQGYTYQPTLNVQFIGLIGIFYESLGLIEKFWGLICIFAETDAQFLKSDTEFS